MARGPAWSEREEAILSAARQIKIEYNHIALVIPNRTPMALRMRFRVMREQAGIPPRPVMTPERGYKHSMIEKGSDMLLAALQRYQGLSS